MRWKAESLLTCWCAVLLSALPVAGQEVTPQSAAGNATMVYPNVVAVESGASFPVERLGELTRIGLGSGISYGRRGLFLENLVVGAGIGYDYFRGEADNVEELQILSLLGHVGYLLPITTLLALEPRLSFGYGYNVLSYAASPEALNQGNFSTESAVQPQFRAAVNLTIPVAKRWEIQVGPEYRVIFEPNETFPSFSVSAGVRFLLPDRARPPVGSEPVPPSLPVVPAPMDTLQAIVTEDTSVEHTERGITIDIRILFEPVSAELGGDALEQLDRLAAGLADFRTNRISIFGHVADVGDSAINMELSQERADAVRSYLIEVHGFDPAILSAEGRGASEPVADNATEEGRTRNRRVEVVVELASGAEGDTE